MNKFFKYVPVVLMSTVALVHADQPDTEVPDQDLQQKVNDKIGPGWISQGYDTVRAQVRNGVVYLSGSVKTASDKDKVEREVRNIDGVTGVESRIRVEEQDNRRNRQYNQDAYPDSRDERRASQDSYSDFQEDRRISQDGYPASRDDRRFSQDSYSNSQNGRGMDYREGRNASQDNSDQEIQKKVNDKIGPGWFSSGYGRVNAQVRDGVVFVFGTVKTASDKDKLERDLRDIEGVVNVASKVRVEPKGEDTRSGSRETYTDQDIQKKVNDKIGPGWVSKGYDKVHAQVRDGVVFVAGSVKTLKDKEKVERELRNIDGVTNLISKLNVEQPESRETGKDSREGYTDQDIQKKVNEKLSPGWFSSGYDKVQFRVRNGVVFVAGSVNSQSDKDKLERDLRNIDGVDNVVSRLVVEQPNNAEGPNQEENRGK